MTLRRKLLVFVLLAAAVPVVVSGLLSYKASEVALSNAVTELHKRSAEAEAEYASSYVQSLGIELSAAIQYEDPASLTAPQQQEFLNRVFLRRNRIALAALLELPSKVKATVFVDDPVAFAREEPQFKLHDTVAAEEVEQFLARSAGLLQKVKPGQPYAISEPYLTAVRRTPAVVVVAPAPYNRTLALAAELGLADLSSRLQANYGNGTRAFFLDRGGKLLIHPDVERERSGVDYRSLLPGAVEIREAGIAQFEEGGLQYLAAFSPVRELNWVAVVARPREEVIGPLRELFRSTSLVLVVSLVALGLLAPLLTRMFAQPIAQLADGAMELARGNFGYRLPLERKDELGHLARTFNVMGKSIEEANAKLVRFNEDLQAQVDERTRELRQAQQQLLRSQRLAAVGDLAAGLAHEVNNPLAAIMGNAQLLLMDVPDEKHPNYVMLTDVLEQAIRISNIVKDLQALSEAQRGGMAPVNVHSALERVVKGYQPELAKDEIELQTRFDPQAADVLGDESS
ncbi:MAG TPA: HAMP domain-containing protein, partial [Myxococcaceae bacterium]|nr:HAMP domain-containing protein [Myxococcaceae bacterium]